MPAFFTDASRPAFAWLLVLASALSACSQGDGYGPMGSTGASGGTSVRRSGAGTSGSTSGTSGSTSGTSGGSSGTTAGTGCVLDAVAAQQSLVDCDAGQLEVLGGLIDVCNNYSPFAAPLTISDRLDATISYHQRGCGFFYACLNPGQVANPQLVTPDVSYFPVTLASLAPSDGGAIWDFSPGIQMLCPTFAGAFLTQFKSPQYLPALSTLLITLQTHTCPEQGFAGWRIRLYDSDGGAVDAGVVYPVSEIFGPASDATAPSGTAVLYNVNPQLGRVRVEASQVDGGPCQVGSFPGLSLEVPTVSAVLTEVPFPIR